MMEIERPFRDSETALELLDTSARPAERLVGKHSASLDRLKSMLQQHDANYGAVQLHKSP